MTSTAACQPQRPPGEAREVEVAIGQAQADQQQSQQRKDGGQPGLDAKAPNALLFGGEGRRQQTGQPQGQRVLDHVGKDQRRDEGVEQAAERPADGHPQKELGEAFRRRPVAGQLAVADHADREEDRQVQTEQPADAERRSRQHQIEENQHEQRQGEGPETPAVQLGQAACDAAGDGREDQDEAEQVENQRRHPQQRVGGHVGGKVRRDAEQEAGGDEGQQHPAQPPPGRRSRDRQGAVFAPFPDGRGSDTVAAPMAGSPQQDGAGEDEQDKDAITGRPDDALDGQRQVRFDEEGVSGEGDQTAEVAGRVEEIRVARGGVIGVREPFLQERGGGGDHEERQPDRKE